MLKHMMSPFRVYGDEYREVIVEIL